MDETIEVLILLVYAMGAAFACYGPNQGIYRKLRNFEEFDANRMFRVLFFMATLEALGSLVCGFLLWIYSRTNLLNEFSYLMRNFWFIVAVRLSWTMFMYFGGNDFNCGSDDTFGWLTDKERRKMIQNSIDSSFGEKT